MGSKAKLVVLSIKLTVAEEGSVDFFVQVPFAFVLVRFGILAHGPPVGLALGEESLCDPVRQSIT